MKHQYIGLKRQMWAFNVLLAIIVCAIFILATGSIRSSGAYSESVDYRYQTNALLDGQLSVGENPVQIQLDWVWFNDRAQQPWGLGIPLLRLPFEAVARVSGFMGFPDRWVFAFYYLLATIIFLTVITKHGDSEAGVDLSPLERTLITLLGFLSPVLIALLNGRFSVYEEAITYLIITNLLVAGFIYRLTAKIGLKMFLFACFMAGFIVLLRPTGIFYSVVAGILLLVISIKHKMNKTSISCGALLYLIAPLMLAATNTIRFGSPVNFGTFEALSIGDELTYAARFSFPFIHESALNAARELFGTLFLQHDPVNKTFSTANFYRPGVHSWQAPLYRLREYYSPGYPLVAVFLLVFGWISAIVSVVRSGCDHTKLLRWFTQQNIMMLWSLLSFSLLFVFYLWTHAISSRYMLDFLPAVAIGCGGALIILLRYFERRLFWSKIKFVGKHEILTIFMIVILLIWSIFYIQDAKKDMPDYYNYINPVESSEILISMKSRLFFGDPSDVYRCGEVRGNGGVMFNFSGWNVFRDKVSEVDLCGVGQSSTILVGPMQCVTLQVKNRPLAKNHIIQQLSVEAVQVKVGQQQLTRTSLEKLPDHRATLRFCADHPLQARWNFMTIGWVDEVQLGVGVAPVWLLQVNTDK